MVVQFSHEAKTDVEACLSQALGPSAVVCERNTVAWAKAARDESPNDDDDITLAREDTDHMARLVGRVFEALVALPADADAQCLIAHLNRKLGRLFAGSAVYDFDEDWEYRPLERVKQHQFVPLGHHPERILLLAEEAVVGLAPFVTNPEVAHWAATRLARLDRGDDLAHLQMRLARVREACLGKVADPATSARRFRP